MDFEKIFRESFDRMLTDKMSTEKAFFDAFYERFLASSPVVAEKFAGVDIKAHKTMLRQSLTHLLNLFASKQIPFYLTEIARKHDHKNADIPPQLYDKWLESLIATVREFDPKVNDDVELAWRMVCAQGISFMTFMHDKS